MFVFKKLIRVAVILNLKYVKLKYNHKFVKLFKLIVLVKVTNNVFKKNF